MKFLIQGLSGIILAFSFTFFAQAHCGSCGTGSSQCSVEEDRCDGRKKCSADCKHKKNHGKHHKSKKGNKKSRF